VEYVFVLVPFIPHNIVLGLWAFVVLL
jgi:hypothetical protein